MKIKYNSIKVKDIHQSVKFYHDILKLEILDEYYSENMSVVMLTDGNIKLELIADSTCEYGLDNIGFAVDNMDVVLKDLRDNDIHFNEELCTKDNHIISLEDCDGVKINIIKE